MRDPFVADGREVTRPVARVWSPALRAPVPSPDRGLRRCPPATQSRPKAAPRPVRMPDVPAVGGQPASNPGRVGGHDGTNQVSTGMGDQLGGSRRVNQEGDR